MNHPLLIIAVVAALAIGDLAITYFRRKYK